VRVLCPPRPPIRDPNREQREQGPAQRLRHTTAFPNVTAEGKDETGPKAKVKEVEWQKIAKVIPAQYMVVGIDYVLHRSIHCSSLTTIYLALAVGSMKRRCHDVVRCWNWQLSIGLWGMPGDWAWFAGSA